MQVFLRHSRIVLALWLFTASLAASAREVRVADGVDVSVEVHESAGNKLLLWLPSGIAGGEPDAVQAEIIRALGIEVWRPDIFGARFLPSLESSLGQVPDSDISALIDAARQRSKRVTLLASASAGLLALRGAQAWQKAHPTIDALDGVILLHPNLYLASPEPGREPEYHPQVARTRLPLHIVQPEKSPWFFQLDKLQAGFERAGARVTVQVLSGVRDRYYFRADATEAENTEATRLPQVVSRGIDALRRTPIGRATPLPVVADVAATRTLARGLQAYRGNPLPAGLQLADLDGVKYDLAEFRQRVVLVNFWASWCPPCVHEMPSMQRLKEKMAGRPFTILAVNMAESNAEVRAFINKLRIDFPVLMDRDGALLKRWKVIVFPTSFIIDPAGRIRYAALGELEWDSPEILQKLSALLPAAP